MDLTRFGVKNLRCFNEETFIDIKPINIFVGKNSSGKSTMARLIPLLMQSFETKTKGPILWFGPYIDFGSFNIAHSKNTDENFIQLFFDIELNPEKQKYIKNRYIYSAFKDPLNILEKTNARVDLKLNYNNESNETYTSEFRILIFNNTIEVHFDNNERLNYFCINDKEVKIADNYLVLSDNSELIPKLLFFKSKRINEVEKEKTIWEYINFFEDSKLVSFVRSRSHGGLSRGNILSFINLIGIASDDYLFKKSSEIVFSSVNLTKFSKSLANDKNKFSQLKFLYFQYITNDLIELVNNSIKKNFSDVKYIKPVRATAQRYYRYQELSIEDIDAEGANIAMFLENLPLSEKNNLNEWLVERIGIEVEPKREGGHIALFILENQSGSKQNIADMGFGYSQVLPILIQAWVSTRQDNKRSLMSRSHKISSLVIEQPELHLHPEMQAKLSNIFAELSVESKKSDEPFPIFIETHSSHIVNRFGELVENDELSKEDICIYLFEEVNGVNKLRKASFNSDGVLENWPFGFFEAGI